MQAFIATTQEWIRTEPLIQPASKPCLLRICISDGSLSRSYLHIEVDKLGCCFIPLTAEVIVTFSSSELTIQFTRYERITLAFTYSDLLELEQVVSHIGKCSLLFNDVPDAFKKQNLTFLKLIKPLDSPAPLKYTQNIGSATALSPITLSPTQKTIWHDNAINQNTQFYVKTVPLRISFLTWNVAGHLPSKDLLSDLSKPFSLPVSAADIVAIAFEEIDMSISTIVTGSSDLHQRWTSLISSSQQDDQYDVVADQSVGSVYLAVLVRKSLKINIKVEEVLSLKLGFGGLLSNKAAVMVPLKIEGTSLMIVGCHLAPHAKNNSQRNKQMHLIIESIPEGYDYVAIFGDLNYRIIKKYEETIEMIEKNSISELLDHDQLKQTQLLDKILSDFSESKILFKPTYKFDKDCDVYDTSAKKRVPSWTDRVLMRTGNKRLRAGLEDLLFLESDAAQHYLNEKGLYTTECNSPMMKSALNFPCLPHVICYRSLRSTFSDHRPVHAAYRLAIPVVDKERLSELEDILSAKFEEMKNLSVPSISMSRDSEGVTISNKSAVWVRWKISSCPQGVVVSPSDGFLIVGASQKINISVKRDEYSGGNIKIEVRRGRIREIDDLLKFTSFEKPPY